jgi:hypothetical protein
VTPRFEDIIASPTLPRFGKSGFSNKVQTGFCENLPARYSPAFAENPVREIRRT